MARVPGHVKGLLSGVDAAWLRSRHPAAVPRRHRRRLSADCWAGSGTRTTVAPGTFDGAVSCLLFSELEHDERLYVMRTVCAVVRAGGMVVIADEAPPAVAPACALWRLVRAPVLAVTDGLPGLALAVEQEEKGLMTRPPRPPGESIFAGGLWQHVVWVGLLIGVLSILGQAWARLGLCLAAVTVEVECLGPAAGGR